MARYDNISRQALKKMLDAAEAAGHTLALEHREPPPEHPGAHIKYWTVCSCGYRSTAARSVSAALSNLAWHAGGALADGPGQAARDGGPTRAPEMPPRQVAGL